MPPSAVVLKRAPADEEFMGSNPTTTAFSGLPPHEITSVNVAINSHSNSAPIKRKKVKLGPISAGLYSSFWAEVGL